MPEKIMDLENLSSVLDIIAQGVYKENEGEMNPELVFLKDGGMLPILGADNCVLEMHSQVQLSVAKMMADMYGAEWFGLISVVTVSHLPVEDPSKPPIIDLSKKVVQGDAIMSVAGDRDGNRIVSWSVADKKLPDFDYGRQTFCLEKSMKNDTGHRYSVRWDPWLTDSLPGGSPWVAP